MSSFGGVLGSSNVGTSVGTSVGTAGTGLESIVQGGKRAWDLNSNNITNTKSGNSSNNIANTKSSTGGKRLKSMTTQVAASNQVNAVSTNTQLSSSSSCPSSLIIFAVGMKLMGNHTFSFHDVLSLVEGPSGIGIQLSSSATTVALVQRSCAANMVTNNLLNRVASVNFIGMTEEGKGRLMIRFF